jgi:equilibrative nucleoside transporter 1/2/3
MTREDKDDEDTGEPTDQMIAEDQASLLTMEDRFYMTYILFYSLGTAMLVPANFYTTATDYWMYKFRNTSTDLTNGSFNTENRTGMQAEFTSDYSIVSNVSNLAFLVLTILIVRKVTIVKRTIGGLCGTVVMFAITCVFVQINTDTWQRGFFVTTLAIGFFLTAFCSVFMVTLFQMVSKFPPGYLAAILNGQSICGILAALLQIFSLSIGASSKTNGLVYFALGMFFIFMTLVGFLMTLARSEYFQHYLNKEVQIERPKVTKKMVFSIFNKIKYYIISMVIVLGCSIMIHPGVTSLVISTHKGNGNKWNDVFFVPVVTFLFYHVSDYFGRELARIIKKVNKRDCQTCLHFTNCSPATAS